LQELESDPDSVSGSIALLLFNGHNPRSNFIKVRDNLIFTTPHHDNKVLGLKGCRGFDYVT
jgi:hypothetical protein